MNGKKDWKSVNRKRKDDRSSNNNGKNNDNSVKKSKNNAEKLNSKRDRSWNPKGRLTSMETLIDS